MRDHFNFDVKQLQSFLEVLNQGSFTRASRKLKVGQATISHHIGQLEKTLGVRLINRTARGISITDQGKAFEAFCRALFRGMEVLADELSGEAVMGPAVVAASTIPAAYILPPCLAGMKKRHPGAIFRVEVTGSREGVEMVKEGSADIGIVGKEYRHRSLVFTPLCDDEIVLVAPARFSDRISASDVAELPLIVREPGSGTRKSAEEALGRLGILPSSLRMVMECSSTEAIRESIAAGIGVSFISRRAVESSLKQKRVKIVEVKGLAIRRSFFSVHSTGRALPRSARMLLECLIEASGS